MTSIKLVLDGSGETYAWFPDETSAEAYVADLKKVFPDEPWEIKSMKPGRRVGQEEMIWGSELAWDLIEGKALQFSRAWIWKGQISTQFMHGVGACLGRYHPFITPHPGEGDAVSWVKRILKGMSFKVEHDAVVKRIV